MEFIRITNLLVSKVIKSKRIKVWNISLFNLEEIACRKIERAHLSQVQ